MDSLVGIRFADWRRLLKDNKYQISLPFLSKSLFITAFSIRNQFFLKREKDLYGNQFSQIDIKQPPVFIIGHWRSGTTFLHNLLSRDEQFAFPKVFEINNPSTFLYIGHRFDKLIREMRTKNRPMDNVIVNRLSPGEEEFAIGILTLMTPLLGWVFPRQAQYYNRYLTFDNVSEEDIKYWKQQYYTYLQKLTFRYEKPLLLKNPLNTGRIRLLRELFPDARFIHIHRNPIDVFRSTRKLNETAVLTSRLQKAAAETDDMIIERYNVMYNRYFRDVQGLDSKHFIDVAFEELEVNPVPTVEKIYQKLSLNGYDTFRPELEKYVESVRNYKKNVYQPVDSSLSRNLAEKWEKNFKAWNYTV